MTAVVVRARLSSRAMEANAGEEAEARVEDSSTRAGETTAVETGRRAECESASEGKGGGEASASASDDAARAKRARVNGRVEVKTESAEEVAQALMADAEEVAQAAG